ncbi:MAG: radical SAM protein [Candidatus Omnitrophica bacterium]|nr:radical SAM protein [Candidatus Omnitrophota bacterium]
MSKIRLATGIYPKVILYKLFKKSVPILVTFGITNRCNLRCEYCFVNLDNRSQKDMPTDKLLSYIDQFIALGTQQIDLQGGEPTLHPDLDVIVSRIVGRGCQCSMATNGFQAKKHLETLKKCYSVCVSLDGLPETTNMHRGQGAYEIAREALEVMSIRRVNVRLHGVLTYRTTIKDINHLVDLAKKYRTNVNFVYALDTGVKKGHGNETSFFSERIKNIVSYIKGIKEKGGPITSKGGAIHQLLNWPYPPQDVLIENEMTTEEKKQMKALKIPRCLWGYLACFFNVDDCLYICPRAYDRPEYYVRIGNQTVKEAFLKLTALKKCYMCGQMGDLSYSFNLDTDNIKTWMKY